MPVVGIHSIPSHPIPSHPIPSSPAQSIPSDIDTPDKRRERKKEANTRYRNQKPRTKNLGHMEKGGKGKTQGNRNDMSGKLVVDKESRKVAKSPME